MQRQTFTILAVFLSIIWTGSTGGLAASTSTLRVEFSSAIHFLNPAGEDVEVGPGVYEVEATESWLKLVPEGEAGSAAVLLEATQGPHEEDVTEPVVRTISNPDTPEVLHLALLMPDGVGMEALGTVTGIRPRALNLAFVQRASSRARRFTQKPRTRKPSSAAAVRRQKVTPPKTTTQSPTPSTLTKPPASSAGSSTKAPTASASSRQPASSSGSLSTAPLSVGKPADCGPYQKRIGGEVDLKIPGKRSVALAVYQNRLHVVAVKFNFITHKYDPLGRWAKEQDMFHWIYEGGQWRPYRHPNLRDNLTALGYIPSQNSKAGVALAVFQNRLHKVHISAARDLRRDLNNIWHSTFDGRQWTPNVKIPGQKSKKTPALAVWNGQLHMVHLGDRSNRLWHSMNKSNGWTVNVRIPGRSSHTPAFGRITSGPFAGRLHMVYKSGANIEPQSLWHAQYDGRQWRRSVMIRGPLTKTAPTLVPEYPYGMHLIHLGKSSDNLWHMLFGPNKNKNNAVEWFDERRLLSEKSQAPVGVAMFQGCYHMVSLKDDKLMHTTYATADIHPKAR